MNNMALSSQIKNPVGCFFTPNIPKHFDTTWGLQKKWQLDELDSENPLIPGQIIIFHQPRFP